MLFGHFPFTLWLNRQDVLVDSMIGFVEDLPEEWLQEWEYIQRKLRPERDPIIGMFVCSSANASIYPPDPSPSTFSLPLR